MYRGDSLKYKMIAMDMDGTLLNNKKEISETTRNILKRASEKGVKLVVCTGRIFTSAKVYAGLIGTKAPIIASNGAYIREKDREEIIFERCLPDEIVKRVIEISEGYGLLPHVFTSNTIYTKKLVYFSANYKRWNDTLPENERVKINLVEDLGIAFEENSGNILKVVVADDNFENVLRAKKEIKENIDASIFSSAHNNFEVMASNISKGYAVERIAKYYGIDRDEIICIGDNENDISMIEYAGLGVAMGNATDELKGIADYITDTNEEDGVAKVIEKFVLNC